jgi:hypothetical protein
MADVNISKYRAQVVREGSRPASPGFVVNEGQNPVDPAGSGQNHLPVTIASASTGLAITDSQVLGGAGTVAQYIRGDGSLADFPATTGGGASVSYYLNGSVSQGTIGGVAYREVNRNPVFGAGTDISISSDGYIASFITDAGDPNKLEIPAGNWNLETYFSASSSGGSPSFYVELYKYNGSTFTLIASSSTAPELIAFGTNLNPYFSTLAVPQTTLALTDRLALRYYVNTSGRTITLHTENNHLCQVITTFTTGLTALNGLTSQVQFFAVGTSGTDFAISSATDTHTFNLPTASATNRGALSAADWSTFNAKMPAITFNAPLFIASGGEVGITQASGSTNGFLSSTDWTTFNNKQNALTNPVTGTGTTNYLSKFTGSTTIGNSQIFDNGTSVGIGTNSLKTVSSGFTLTIGDGSTQVQPYIALSRNSLGGFWSGIRWYDGDNIKSVIQEDSDFNLRISTSNTERARITSGGNLLVGTTTDAGYKLDVSGTLRSTGRALLGNSMFIGEVSGSYSIIETTGSNGIWLRPAGVSSPSGMFLTSGGNVLIGTTTDNGARLQVSANTGITIGSTSRAFIRQSAGGDAEIGAALNGQLFVYSNNSIALTFSGSGAATFSSLGTGTVYSNGGTLTNTNPSDLNLKTNVAPINYGLDEILKLNPVTFDWKNDTINQGKQYGFIAQEVQKIMPDLVKQGEYLGLDKEAIFTTLVKAIQELKQEIDTLKN